MQAAPPPAGDAGKAEGAVASASSRELIDFIALVLLAIKEEIEDLQQMQTETAEAFSRKLMELGAQVPSVPEMGEIIALMQGDDLRNQRQQHVINALRYVENIIHEQAGRNWAPSLTERAAGWGEGLIAGQTLEQVRTHFHHYLMGSPHNTPPRHQRRTPDNASEVELF
ncbi:hypothetical protein [Ferrovibrio sp.]